ncbi:MAG: DUF2298 domain-containing protein [Chloroflexi bacterium]|nr:DUF2298 domain-containing protein [Chloroflexota bacterium]
MIGTLTWWLLVELIGLAAWPVAHRFFRGLPDRGYAFVKPLGLLFIAYPFWLLTTLGFLTNTQGDIAIVALAVAAGCWWFAERASTAVAVDPASENGADKALEGSGSGESSLPTAGRPAALLWLRENLTLVVVVEVVFTLAFFAWVLVRAYMPDITATEKPMEFAFLNGVLQSAHFPPRDPWLAGYGISYYYFGYIMMGMLTMLSGVVSSIAFNLGIALLFALAATGAFGLAYDLIRGSRLPNPRALFYSLFAPLLLLVVGNLEGVFEALHADGWGTGSFWTWLDVKGLAEAPITHSFVPNDNWWWWRASRVIHDVALGQTQEVIDEFPQFSFLLGDMHPHVLALPFVLLALAVALNLLNTGLDVRELGGNIRRFASSFILYPLVLGGLFFLNSWDILPYGFIILAAFVVARFRSTGSWDQAAWRDLVVFAVALGALSVLLYLPFYIGFQSQAGGILPTLFVKTALHQYLIMFGVFVFVIVAFALALLREQRAGVVAWVRRAFPFAVGFALFPAGIALVVVAALRFSPSLQDQARSVLPGAAENLVPSLLSAYVQPLLADPWLFLLLVALLAALLALLSRLDLDNSKTFVLILMFTGLLLTFGVEFVYLRDQFGTRMNTVFKFYFQTWTLFSVASAYAIFYLSRVLNGLARTAWFAGLAVLLAAGLVYPALAIPNRADNFAKAPTLDGLAWIRETNPGDYAAIQWLDANAPRGSTIVEAVGDDYSYGNRISMATGLPTVLGWFGHESQWRGNTALFKNDAAGIDRPADIAQLYQTVDTSILLTLLDKYDIKFVVVGPTERTKYALTKSQVDKFGRVMTLVSDNDNVRVYARAN